MHYDPQPYKGRTPLRRIVRVCQKLVVVAILLYVTFLVLGFVPTNRSYLRPKPSSRVTIYVGMNAIHTNIIMPVKTKTVSGEWNWRNIFPQEHFHQSNIQASRYISVGWGDRGFYFDTPKWSDLSAKTVAKAALVPSQSVMHVDYRRYRGRRKYLRPIDITQENYERLAAHIVETIGKTEDGVAVPLTDFAYGKADRFYHAKGSYHAFNTCNQWTGQALRKAGVPTGIWTPLKTQVLNWLPDQPFE